MKASKHNELYVIILMQGFSWKASLFTNCMVLGQGGGEKNVQLVSLSICNVVKEMSSDISKRKIFKLYLSEDT